MLRYWIPIAASCLCFGSFAWALRGHFQQDRTTPVGMKLLSAASVTAFCAYAWQLRSVVRWPAAPLMPGPSLLAGMTLYTLSLLLFWWSVATTRSNRPRLAHAVPDTRVVHTAGPYGLVRHPFYLSYILFWLGTAITAGGLQWPAAAIMIGWYVLIARHEESRFGDSAMQGAYRAYRQRTAMLLPYKRSTLSE